MKLKRFGLGKIITTCLAIGCAVRKVKIQVFMRRDGKFSLRASAYGKVWKSIHTRCPKMMHALCLADEISLFGLALAEEKGQYRA